VGNQLLFVDVDFDGRVDIVGRSVVYKNNGTVYSPTFRRDDPLVGQQEEEEESAASSLLSRLQGGLYIIALSSL